MQPPAVKNTAWCITPIDRFILAKLEARGLKPSLPADRRSLIRRVTFDLIGLPPTPAEVDAFVQSRDPQAYEKVVDRLLASPRYGERWARHWLDVVHYGDTHGYDKDKRRDNAWRYRDYVIRALNQDKPYARFIREQIAGDALWPNDPDAVTATGFVAAGPWDFVGNEELREGTVEKAKTRLLDRDDMVANTISTFDSVTVHCARCHDHKFDPIPQRDYYALQACFAGVDRRDRPLPDSGSERSRLESARQAAEASLVRSEGEIAAAINASPQIRPIDEEIASVEQELKRYPPLPPGDPSPTNGYHSAISNSADAEKWVQIDLGKSYRLDTVRIIPARPTDFPDTPGFGFPLEFRVDLADTADFKVRRDVFGAKGWDYPNPGANPISIPCGGISARYIRVTASRLWQRTGDYVFALAEVQALSEGKLISQGASVTALDTIEAGRWGMKNLVDGFDSHNRLPDLANPSVLQLTRRRDDLIMRIAKLGIDRRLRSLAAAPPDLLEKQSNTRKELTRIDLELKALAPAPMVYALQTHAARPVSVLSRGDVEKPLEAASPGALTCVSGLSADFHLPADAPEGARRIALADWIASPKNALTWRSIVNRVWHYHFGKGLVDTPNDFGRNGGTPSHPEMLDWLAARFRDSGSLKALHRMIVLSATYRQSSAENPAYAKVDGDNRLLWRMNRQRLDSEEVRDAVLAVSGKLDLTMGGPGFELFRFKDDHSPVYDHTAIEKINDRKGWRRSVYRFVVRSVPNPFMECLDCADPNVNTPVRNTTLTALQALALLNDPFMVDQAEHFAQRLSAISKDAGAQIWQACRLALGRAPGAAEQAELAAYTHKHGLAAACRLLFNTNEFVFVD